MEKPIVLMILVSVAIAMGIAVIHYGGSLLGLGFQPVVVVKVVSVNSLPFNEKQVFFTVDYRHCSDVKIEKVYDQNGNVLVVYGRNGNMIPYPVAVDRGEVYSVVVEKNTSVVRADISYSAHGSTRLVTVDVYS